MIVIKHVGAGLGNQLNLLAIYSFLQRRYKSVKMQDHDSLKYSYDGKTFQLGIRNLIVDYKKSTRLDEIIMKITGAPIIDEKDVEAIMNIRGNAYVSGYFSNAWPGYDDQVIEDVKKMIAFPVSLSSCNIDTLTKIDDTLSVSVHFRRTDYLYPENQNMNIAGDIYYKSAIDYVLGKYSEDDPVFFFFSDDRSYLDLYLESSGYASRLNYVIVNWNDGDDGIYDFQMMSRCKINICANSSFSTWAAQLNDYPGKEIIKPMRNEDKDICFLYRKFTFINAETGEVIDKSKCRVEKEYNS